MSDRFDVMEGGFVLSWSNSCCQCGVVHTVDLRGRRRTRDMAIMAPHPDDYDDDNGVIMVSYELPLLSPLIKALK